MFCIGTERFSLAPKSEEDFLNENFGTTLKSNREVMDMIRANVKPKYHLGINQAALHALKNTHFGSSLVSNEALSFLIAIIAAEEIVGADQER